MDELLAMSAVVLWLRYPVTIWAIRTKHPRRAFFLARMSLTMFLSAATLLIHAPIAKVWSAYTTPAGNRF